MSGETVVEATLKLEGFGVGVIEPTNDHSDDEVAKAVQESQAEIEDSAIVCIDERDSVEGIQPVRRKTGGGGAITGFMAGVMSGWSMYSRYDGGLVQQDPNEVFAFTAQYLQESGLKLACHIDNHASEKKTSCWANDGIPVLGGDILDDQIVAEIKPVVDKLMSVSSEFDAKLFDQVIDQTRPLSRAGFFNKWQSILVPKVIVRLDGVVEVLNGDKDALRDPENLRHNHWAEAINYNLNRRKSNTRDHNIEIPYFQLDKDGIDEPTGAMGTSDYELGLLQHAAHIYNALLARRLTRNQRVTVTS